MHCLLVACLTLAVLLPSHVVAAEPPNDCPRLRIIPSLTADDPDELVLARIVAKVGCPLQERREDKEITLARRFEMLKKGQIDLISALSKKPERETFVYFSLPVRVEKFRAWIRKIDRERAGNKTVKQLLDDHWLVLGPQQGYYGPFYQGIRENRAIISGDFLVFEQGVRALLRRRGDLLLGDEGWLKRLPVDLQNDIEVLPEVLHEEPLYLAFSRVSVSPETVRRFNDAIVALKLP